MTDLIENKKVPPLSTNDEVAVTQDDFCEIAACQDIDLDCKDCIFDSKRCPKWIFDKWLNTRNNE